MVIMQLNSTFLLASLVLLSIHLRAEEPIVLSEPIFQTGVPNPTQDKPQSKLWYAHGRYWAWLPVANGSTVLEQTPTGWRELIDLRIDLVGLPGQADVWSESNFARAVLVGKDRLAVVELAFDSARQTYLPGNLRYEFPLPEATDPRDPLETATIARDSKGRWWIAFDRNRSVFVAWTTDNDGTTWSHPREIGSKTDRDDISAIFALPDRIGVIWSDQVADGVFFREHLDNQPVDQWNEPATVEQGGKTADDHFNGVVAKDGTLYVATKNSVDQIGVPQQVLRIRRPDGHWENHPYATLEQGLGPSRPIVQLVGPSQQLFLMHTYYDRRDAKIRKDFVAGFTTDRQSMKLDQPSKRILSAKKSVNNVTGTKTPVPDGVPILVLASDADGGVYTASPFVNSRAK